MKWVWLTYPWGLINSNITSSLWLTERLHSSAKLCYFYQKSIQHLVLHLNLCPRGTTCHLILVNFKGVSRCLKQRQRFSRDEILNQEYRLDSFSISFHQFSSVFCMGCCLSFVKLLSDVLRLFSRKTCGSQRAEITSCSLKRSLFFSEHLWNRVNYLNHCRIKAAFPLDIWELVKYLYMYIG